MSSEILCSVHGKPVRIVIENGFEIGYCQCGLDFYNGRAVYKAPVSKVDNHVQSSKNFSVKVKSEDKKE